MPAGRLAFRGRCTHIADMAGRLLLLFIALPLAETCLLIEVGSRIGALPTILAVIATAVIGSQLMRRQGMETLREIQRRQQRGEIPAGPMLEGVALLIAGVLLITPGFISDTLGFLLLVPPLRTRLARALLSRVFVLGGAAAGFGAGAGRSSETIEGKFRRED